MTLENIIDCALEGDVFAANLIKEAGTYLGYGLMNTIYAYNPDTIVLSRLFAAAGDLYLDAIRKILKKRLNSVLYRRIRIEFSNLTQDPVILGMVSMVTDHFFMTPSNILGLKANGA